MLNELLSLATLNITSNLVYKKSNCNWLVRILKIVKKYILFKFSKSTKLKFNFFNSTKKYYKFFFIILDWIIKFVVSFVKLFL